MAGRLLDLRPLIKRKQQEACKHDWATVSMTVAVLTCDDCDAPLDPWWYLRHICQRDEEMLAWRKRQEEVVDDKIEEVNKSIARGNETIMRLNAEIKRLTDLKSELFNERVGDRQLGAIAARPNRRVKK